MKHLLMYLAACLLFCLPIQAQIRNVTLKDNQGKTMQIIELHDTVIDGKKTTDTLSITTYEKHSYTDEASNDALEKDGITLTYGHDLWNNHLSETLVSIIAIVAVFGMPVFILFIIFYYRNKQRKAKYKLAEQILASGQPLPENFFKNETYKDLRSKGISNICLGLGLFIFLWALTESFGLGCIGLLIMFTGIGQVVIHRGQQPSRHTPFMHTDNTAINNQQKEQNPKP